MLTALGATGLAAGLAGRCPAWAQGGADGDSIGALAEAAGIKFGTCIEKEVFEDAGYGALVQRECRILIDATSLTFGWMRPEGPEANFAPADRLVAYAEGLKLPFRATTLIWNDYLPEWIKRQSRREAARVFDSHIDETAGRYAGRIHTWDVVNEPFAPWDGEPGNYRKGAWYDAIGPDYIERALRRTAAADPRARLLVNEAFCERDDDLGRTVRTEFMALVKRLRDKDVPLHAVGFQGHLQPQYPFDDQVFARFISDIAAEGVAIYITELDVDDRGFPADAIERDRGVARRYREFLNAVLDVPAVQVVNMWGLADSYTWYRDVAREAGTLELKAPRPLPYDAALGRKEAWYAIAGAFAARAGRTPG